MAFPADDGDIRVITELGRTSIPGAGHSKEGAAKNNKVITWGRITGLYKTTGLDLVRHGQEGGAFGLSTIDHVSLSVRTAGTAGTPTNPTSDNQFLAELGNANKIFVVDQMGQANPAVPSDTDTIVIDYVAIGEELGAPELI